MPKNSSNIDVTLPSIQEQIDCFLKKISDKYIETMKNNTVFAGPIELKTIGKILSSKIVVHYYILNPNAPSFEYAENDIHILFKDKNTYQAILKTLNGNYKLSKTRFYSKLYIHIIGFYILMKSRRILRANSIV